MRILFLLFSLSFTQLLFSQNEQVVVTDILIEGNKKTKEKTILRELDFAFGDTIPTIDLISRLRRSEELLLNTGLFTLVRINIKIWNADTNHISINIELHEMWYLYPFYIFELADRNFNVWWEEQERSLKRINYGGRLTWLNLTGRRDLLKATIQFGYTKKFELSYNRPMLGKSQNLGGFAEIHYSNGKEIAYITKDSRLLFKRQFGEPSLLTRFRLGAGVSYRQGLNKYHTGKIIFSDNSIGDTISQTLNPDYFLESRNQQQHFTLQYAFTLDKRDVKAYPQDGNLFTLLLQKDGFGLFDDLNIFAATGTYAHYFHLGKKLSFGAKLKGRYTFTRAEQPYTHVSALGYLPDFLRSYELYVIDGMDYAYAKTHFQFRIFQKKINWGKYMFVPQFRLMPLKVYIAINNDFGYANAPYNGKRSTLSNKFLWGRGVGLDFVVFQDKVWQFEYSYNHLGEHGFFLHFEFLF
ncbi:MAG: BamA/TamA family outer membrane protein [Saprospiraceae bacterium]|nr:BamA/TamA family outer membrane protein [Saprospiraceae bacterium]MDG2419846.1 BamA/TamA family outer membrane protein [Saprospiraceae bacterium]